MWQVLRNFLKLVAAQANTQIYEKLYELQIHLRASHGFDLIICKNMNIINPEEQTLSTEVYILIHSLEADCTFNRTRPNKGLKP